MNSLDSRSVGYQLGMLVLIIGVLFFVGQLFMAGILGMSGIDISSGSIGPIETVGHRQMMRLGAILSHVIPYTIGSLIWLQLFYKERIFSFLKWEELPPMGFIGLSLLLLILAYPLVVKVTEFSLSLPLPEWATDMSEANAELLESLLTMNSPSELILSLLLVGVAPAIGEELLYRGILQNKLKEVLPNPHMAILIASALFSLNHFAIERFLGLMILGMVIGYAYHYSRNFWVPVILHFINNSMQVMMLYSNKETMDQIDMDAVPELPLISAVISSILAVWVLYSMNNLSKKEFGITDEQEFTA